MVPRAQTEFEFAVSFAIAGDVDASVVADAFQGDAKVASASTTAEGVV
jgi:hypothetical protein